MHAARDREGTFSRRRANLRTGSGGCVHRRVAKKRNQHRGISSPARHSGGSLSGNRGRTAMRPYFAVLKDSFREAFASRVLWVLLILTTLLLLALAPLGLKDVAAPQEVAPDT